MLEKKLKNIHFFSELSTEELKLIASFAVAKKIPKGKVIFFETEPYRGFYCVSEGLVKIYKISKEGKEHIVHLIKKDNTFAEVPLFEKYGEVNPDDLFYPANSMAIDDENEVILISSNAFLKVLEKNKNLCMKLISNLCKRLRYLNNHIENLTLRDVSKRLAVYILKELSIRHKSNNLFLMPRKENTIELSITKNDLASYLGTINETLSRSLSKMQKENIIEVNGRQIEVIDRDALQKLTN